MSCTERAHIVYNNMTSLSSAIFHAVALNHGSITSLSLASGTLIRYCGKQQWFSIFPIVFYMSKKSKYTVLRLWRAEGLYFGRPAMFGIYKLTYFTAPFSLFFWGGRGWGRHYFCCFTAVRFREEQGGEPKSKVTKD